MNFWSKNVSILILSTGYWRSDFFTRLFKKYAHIVRIKPDNDMVSVEEARSFDYVFWENGFKDIDFLSRLDEKKLFLFDYQDGGSVRELYKIAAQTGLNPRGNLVILPEKGLEKGYCLPYPPPKLEKKFSWNVPDYDKRKEKYFLLCSPTFLYMDFKSDLKYSALYDGKYCYNQRLEWAEKMLNARLLTEKMGIVIPQPEYLSKENISKLFSPSQEVFRSYFEKKFYVEQLLNSKVILCPAGHSRWTYRLFEAMYYKGLPVTCWLGNHNSLPQFPIDVFVEIEDGGFNMETMEKIIAESDSNRKRIQRGYEWVSKVFTPATAFKKCTYKPAYVKTLFNHFIDQIS